MKSLDFLLDNPILTMFFRSRTRRSQILPWIVIVLVMCVFGIWFGTMLTWPGMDGAVTMFLAFQTMAIVYLGMYRVASAIGGARQTGILDFHRVAPLSPAATTFGFFFGPPAAEYLLARLAVPFAIYCASQGDVGILNFIYLEISLLLGAWLFHSIGMLSALASRKPKGPRGAGIGGVIILFFFTGQLLFMGLYYATRILQSGAIPKIRFFSLSVHWLIFQMINFLPLLGFLFLGSVRMMHWERAHPYTKTSALAFMLTICILIVGDFGNLNYWNLNGLRTWGVTLAAVYPLMLFGMVMASTVTPDRAEYMRGLLRAKRLGKRRPGPFEDAALNRTAVFLLCTLLFATTTLISSVIVPGPPASMRTASMAIAVAVLTLAAVSFCHQFFMLRAGRSGGILTALTLFFFWMLPLIAGGVLQAASINRSGTAKIGQVLIAICPLAGIGIVGSEAFEDPNNLIRLAAIASPLTLAFVFSYLVIVAQRRLELVTRTKPHAELGDGLLEPVSMPVEA